MHKNIMRILVILYIYIMRIMIYYEYNKNKLPAIRAEEKRSETIMALVKVLDKYDLQREFQDYNRDYFSLEGYQELLNLFEECDCGTNTDLDVIAICCDFDEDNPETIINDYDNIDEIADARDDDGDIDADALMDALNYHTWAILLDNGNILYEKF